MKSFFSHARWRYASLAAVLVFPLSSACTVDPLSGEDPSATKGAGSAADVEVSDFEATSDEAMPPAFDEETSIEDDTESEAASTLEPAADETAEDMDLAVDESDVSYVETEESGRFAKLLAEEDEPTLDGVASFETMAKRRCSHLDVCKEGDVIYCPDGTVAAGVPAYFCDYQEEKDPATGERCMAFTWFYVGGCDKFDDEEWEDRLYQSKVLWRYYRGSKGRVFARYRTKSGKWSKAKSLGGSVLHGPSVRKDANGRPVVLITGTDGKLRLKRYLGKNKWSAWSSMGSSIVGKAVFGKTHDGRLKIFGVNKKGTLNVRTQSKPASTKWTGWTSLGSPKQGLSQWTTLHVLSNENGVQEVFAKNTAGNVAVRRESKGAPWIPLGAHTLGNVWTRPERIRYGYLKVTNGVVGHGRDQRWMRYQTAKNSDSWADWTYCPLP